MGSYAIFWVSKDNFSLSSLIKENRHSHSKPTAILIDKTLSCSIMPQTSQDKLFS